MNSGQAGNHCGRPGAQRREDPSNRPGQSTTPDRKLFENGRIEIDEDLPSPESEAEALKADDDCDDDEEEVGDTGSVFAMSTYPSIQPAFQVEYPYQNGMDSDTMCVRHHPTVCSDMAMLTYRTRDSSRTLYAEDFDFVVENGRRYCGDYFLPVDQTEQTRQYVIHQVYLKLFDLELTTVPLEDPRYILDIGTGIGEWAIGMAEKYPQCEVFGTDIAPIQPTHQVPSNVEFHIESAEDEWLRPPDTVDLVHLRNMEGAFSDWRFIYSQAFECIRPGGWIEIIDWEDFFADKNYLSFFPEGSAAYLLVKATMEAAEIAGKPRGAHYLDKDLLVEAGFVDVKETVYDLGIGSRENGSYGKFWLFSIVTGIEPTCLRLLTRDLGWDAQVVRDLCEQVAHETRIVADDPARVDAFVVKLRVMVARKPLVAGQWTAKTLNENGEIKECSGDESTIGDRTVRSEGTM
ncbi:Demethylmenaquinone methyltransferase [Madurella mycetomatis]|uniref:Demethylmenaquinone methyltransferase n=1 Tax=Madurella mycetomatis TaxID=100816 RepID=A0A175VUM5_9PEZI|nr:Demethylmenaquinone methyltransferase [Madurella mycetomatis]